MIHIDTHVAVWLYADAMGRFPATVRETLTTADLVISPMARLQLDFLHEIGRTAGPSSVVLGALSSTVGLRVDDTPFALVAEHAAALTWTRDPFDRIIVANALAADAPLLTADKRILDHCPEAFWNQGPKLEG